MQMSLVRARSHDELFYTAGFKGNPATHHCSTSCVCVFVMCLCVLLSVFCSVWMMDIMLPLTITYRPKFPGLLEPPSNWLWKHM